MKGLSKRIVAQAVAFAMTFQMAGQLSIPINAATVYADDEIRQEEQPETPEEPEEEPPQEPEQSAAPAPVYEETKKADGGEDAPQYQDMVIEGGKTLDLNGNTLIVHGNVNIFNSGNLVFNKGELICNDFSFREHFYSHCMVMKNPNDKLTVNGNFTYDGDFSGDNASSGTIEVRGNVNVAYNFNPNKDNKLVLNGVNKQTVNVNGTNSCINILDIANSSEEGVEFTSPLSVRTVSGSIDKLNFSFGGTEGKKLISDSDTVEIDGDYKLAYGTLDLDGKTLIINGDLIQSGGKVDVNGGRLVVKGDYRLQSGTRDTGFDYSVGELIMTNESDRVEVSGDFVMQSSKNHEGKLTNGKLTVGRNFSQLNAGNANNFRTSGSHTTVFNANEDGHRISFANASADNSRFTNLTFGDGSNITLSTAAVTMGVLSGTDCTVSGYMTLTGNAKVDGKYAGDLRVYDYTLNSDIEAAGNLLVDGSLNLSSYEFAVDGNIYQNSSVNCGSGTLRCKGDLSNTSYLSLGSGKVIVEGSLTATDWWHSHIYISNKDAEIIVGKNFGFSVYSNDTMSAGSLKISGDCNIYSSSFQTGSNFDLILEGSEKQKLNVTESGAKLSKITIENTSAEGIEITKAFNYDTIINNSNAPLFFTDGGIIATGEPQTAKTKTIDGDLVLAMGDLDLNGNTLIINGDFIQAGGNVILNGGHLIVKGDYRLQTKSGDSYTYSSGILNMTNDSDLVEVSGSFVTQSTKNHNGKLTNGKLIVGKNFSQINAGSDSANNFYTSGSHTTVFNANEDGHRISFANASADNSHFTNLTFGGGSNITLSTAAVTMGVLSGADCTVGGYMTLAGSASVDGKYAGDLRVNGYTLNSDIEAAGNLLVDGSLNLSSYEFKVDGNIYQNSSVNCGSGTLRCKGDLSNTSYLSLNSGKVIVEGSLTATDWWHSHIYISNKDAELRVGKDFSFSIYNNDDLTAGTLIVSGDCNLYSASFKPRGSFNIVLDGGSKQTFNVTDSNIKIPTLTVRNTSDEGVEITKVFNYDTIKNESNARLFFSNGGIVATGEPQTEKTKTIDGDLILAMGSLDLNGNTLIVNGDLIQQGGSITLNGGHLVVKGSYRLQTKNDDGGFTYGTGILNMTNSSDLVEVSGDFVMQSTKSHNGKLTDGKLVVGGNFSQLDAGSDSAANFKASGEHTTVFKGKKRQTVSFANPNESGLANVVFENNYGITLNSVVKANGKVTDTSMTLGGGSLTISDLAQIAGNGLSGNVNLTASAEKSVLTKDLTFGNLTCNYLDLESFRLSANSLSVNNSLDIGKGVLELRNDLYIGEYGYLKMTDPAAKVVVGGSLTINSRNTNDKLTDGTLEIKGDFIHNRNSDFVCSGGHRTILSGKSAANGRAYVQTIAMYKAGSKFNKLVIKRPRELFDLKYYGNGQKVEFTDICSELTEEFSDIEAPSKVTGLAASEISAGMVHLVWNASEDNVGVIGYEVYRNGEKLVTTGRTEYIDRSVSPDESYSYQVFAFDKERNYSDGSEQLNIRAAIDTEAPSVPQNIKFSAVTGSALTLSWSASMDNIGTAGYAIYRDNEEIARTADREYRDVVPSKTKKYSYMVKAYDEAGNLSEFSDVITGSAVMPKISSVSPEDGSMLGGSSQDITVVFDKIGNGEGNKVLLRWKEAGADTYEILTSEPLSAESYIGNQLCAKYKWDTSALEGSYALQAELLDADGNSDLAEVYYIISNSGPEAPQNLRATSENGTVDLKWNRTSSLNCTKYNIYRLDPDEEEFKKLVTLSDRTTVRYVDRTAEAGKTYKYKLAGVDSFGTEGAASNTASITVTADELEPEIEKITSEKPRLNDTAKIIVEAEDNIGVKAITLSYKKETDDDYTVIGTKTCSNGRAVFDWDTTALSDGEYSLLATAEDVNGNLSLKTVAAKKIFTVDNTGISKIRINEEKCTAASNYITLSWEDVPETDFGYFSVERKKADGSFEETGSSKTVLGLHVQDLSPDTEYTFRVVGYDDIGNRGIPSDEITLTTVADNIAPVIKSFSPKPGAYSKNVDIRVIATDNTGVSEVRLAYSSDSGNEKTWYPLTSLTEGTNNVFNYSLDLSEMSEGTVFVKATAVDAFGNESTPVTNEFLVDRTAPDEITDLSAQTGEGNIHLIWTVTGEDTAKYLIYRSEDELNSYSLISECSTKDFYDTTAKLGVLYSYKIRAVDAAGNTSGYSNEAVAQIKDDTVKPQVLGFSRRSGAKLHASPGLSVISTDNYSLANVTVEYRSKTAAEGLWNEIGTFDISSNYCEAEFVWDTTGLPDGEYEFRAYCEDLMGNISDTFTAEYILDNTAPEAPKVIATPGDFRIGLDWDDDDDTDHYDIYRKEPEGKYVYLASTTTPSYTDDEADPNVDYTYRVDAYDEVGNHSESDECDGTALDNDTIPPVIIFPDELYGIAGEQLFLDGSACTDNVKIRSYKWSFSTGATAYGRSTLYRINEAGEYSLTLTVEDTSGNISQKDVAVKIYEPTEYGFVDILVTDTNNVPLPHSNIYIYSGTTDGIHTLRTSYDGTLRACVKIGSDKIAAYNSGYMPEEKRINVNSGNNNQPVHFALKSGELVTGEFSVHKMDINEMRARGIDFESEANHHVLKYTIELGFEDQPIPTVYEYYVREEDGELRLLYTVDETKNNGGGGGVSIGVVKREDGEDLRDILTYMKVDQEISFMKDMFAVNLGVINNAPAQYCIEDSTVKLKIPDGLSLADMNEGRTNEVKKDMGNIWGQHRKNVGWILRGDKPGEYDLAADFHGWLKPFEDVAVFARFRTNEPIKVTPPGDGLVLHVMPENVAYAYDNYLVQFALENAGDHSFYDLKTSFGPYFTLDHQYEDITIDINDRLSVSRTAGTTYAPYKRSHYSVMPVLVKGDIVMVKVFNPGDILYGTYLTTFVGNGSDPYEYYYKLRDYIVNELTEDANVRVVVEPISSHISKRRIVQILVEDYYHQGDPVDMTTGAFTDKVNAMSIGGDSKLELNLNYNSLDVPEKRAPDADDAFWYSQKGHLGYGWSHDYEMYLDIKSNAIDLHWDPTNFMSFVDEKLIRGDVEGEEVDGIVELKDTDDSGKKTYICINGGKKDYTLSRDENGTYTIELPDRRKYEFDSEGKLIKAARSDGTSVSLSYVGDTETITDDITGAKIVLNYSADGLLTSVTDGNGRITTMTYENDLLTSVTNPLGVKVVYTYDEKDRLRTSAVEGSAPYVTNTYDDEGRVIVQDDADPNTPLSYFSYSELKNNDFVAVYTDRNGNTVKYVSDAMGHLKSVTDQNNNTVNYSYDRRGNIVDKTEADGGKSEYTYDKDDNLVKVKTVDGNETTMTYDERGNVLDITSPAGTKEEFTYSADNRVLTQTANTSAKKTYTYNGKGQMTSEKIEGLGKKTYHYTDGRLSSVTDYENNTSYSTYDKYGNLHSETNRDGHETVYGYDLLNRIVSVTNEDGTQTRTYDDMGNKTSVTDARGNTTYYTYNANGWCISETNAKGTVSYAYDNEGRVIRRTNTDGTTAVYTYDGVGNLTSSTNENGELSTLTYDDADRVVTATKHGETESTVKFSYYPNGKPKTVTYPDGSRQSFSYDEMWRVTKITDNGGNSATAEYDVNGNLVKAADAEGNSVSYTYDKYGRVTSYTDANGNVTTYDEYDLNGSCTKYTLPNGLSVKFVYDKEGRITKIVKLACGANGEDISISCKYDAAGRVTEYTDEDGNTVYTEYDAAGNVVRMVDAENNEYTNEYDELNNLILSVNADDVSTQYTYDSMGSLVKTIRNLNTEREQQTSNTFDNLRRISTSTDAESGTARYTYDGSGNIVSVTYPNGGVNTYAYDIMGRLTESQTAIGSKTTYTYNDIGKLASKQNARGQTTTYEYYKNGWIKSMTDELGTVSYTYDGNGNVLTVTDENGTITRTYDSMDHVISYTDFRGNTIGYAYDKLGNLTSMTYPDGRTVSYTYYNSGLVKTVTDWNGRVTSYKYDGNGKLTETVRPDGSVEKKTYDSLGRLTAITDKNGESVINNIEYAYDESGNVTTASVSGAMPIDGLTGAEMKYNAANQLIEYNGEEVRYDADGNMIYGPLNGRMVTFVYDCRNRLISAGGITYEYDAENNRISQTENGVKTSYVIDNSSRSLSRILFMTKGSETTEYVYGNGLIAQESGSEYLTYHFDNLGSTKAVTDENGSIAETFDYGPFGELLSANETGIIFLYNGQLGVVTDGNGLYYMRARYYDPEIKRFINQDVLLGTITNTPSLNRYSYVNGNPIKYNDPFGLCPNPNGGSDTDTDPSSNYDPNREPSVFRRIRDGIIHAIKDFAINHQEGTQLLQDASQEWVGTLSAGFSGSIKIGNISTSKSIAFGYDTHGNIALVITETSDVSTGDDFDLSFGANLSVTNAKTVEDLSGAGISAGGSVNNYGLSVDAGVDADKATENLFGAGYDIDDVVTSKGFTLSQSYSLSDSSGISGSVSVSNTQVIPLTNVFDDWKFIDMLIIEKCDEMLVEPY